MGKKQILKVIYVLKKILTTLPLQIIKTFKTELLLNVFK